MLNRRKFFLMSLATAIAPSLSACGRGNQLLTTKVLKGSIPPQLVGAFKDQLQDSANVNFDPISQLSEIYESLQQQETLSADLVTLGDYWLKDAIANQLIQPIPVQQLKNWEKLPSRWQQLAQRDRQGNPDPGGKIWGIPYRWGSTVIAYKEDKFRQAGYDPPTDWKDLWREPLRDRISLLDHDREVIGLTLKKLGASYNTDNLDEVPNLKSQLAALQEQVKFYSSDAYLQPLILGDTWVAVGWLSDFLQLQNRYPDIKVIMPSSGTALWADLWIRPASQKTFSEHSAQWIDFCLQQESATKIGVFTNASSPRLLTTNPEAIPSGLRDDPLRNPPSEVWDQNEFLLPLSPESQQQYQKMWKKMRYDRL